MSLTEEELAKLRTECRKLPQGKNHRVSDYIINVFDTVLDFQMKAEVVDSSIGFYEENRWNELRTHKALAKLISSYPNTKRGNMQLAKYLWNNNHWSRAKFLRELVAYFESVHVRNMRTLSRWARSTDFEQGVKGRIKTKEHSMGLAIFKWLQGRVGVDTVKPDVHLKNFVRECIGRKAKDEETVEAVEVIAKEMHVPAFRMDAAIWHFQRDKSIRQRQERIAGRSKAGTAEIEIEEKGGK